MPEYFEFNDGVYADGETTIKPDADVRMKLQGVKYEQSGIVRLFPGRSKQILIAGAHIAILLFRLTDRCGYN